MGFAVGVSRRVITPPWGVELAGLGYYLQRTWKTIRDDLAATAMVVTDDDANSVALVAMDLMYNDQDFTRCIRELAAAHTDIRPEAICVNCSHSHNAPTAGLIRGGGEVDAEYLSFAARQAATAVVMAWHNRQPAKLFAGWSDLSGVTYNRTRDGGPVDTRVSVLRADRAGGQPLAVAVNFHAHPCAHTQENYRAVSRDVPGEMVDQLESALPGATVMYLQGTAGDVNFHRDSPEPHRRMAPGRALTGVALEALALARPLERPGVKAISRSVSLPTRRWTRDEVMRDREEGLHRLRTGDTTGWLEGIARVVVNVPERLPARYDGSVERTVAAVSRFAVEWTDQILPDLDTRPESLETEVQALRIGDAYFAAHPAELFSTLGFELRRRWLHEDLFILGYSNARIGYMPDAYDIQRNTYAAVTSPRFTGQFPFTAESGSVFIDALNGVLQETDTYENH